jgi:hypothetical protein
MKLAKGKEKPFNPKKKNFLLYYYINIYEKEGEQQQQQNYALWINKRTNELKNTIIVIIMFSRSFVGSFAFYIFLILLFSCNMCFSKLEMKRKIFFFEISPHLRVEFYVFIDLILKKKIIIYNIHITIVCVLAFEIF